MGVVDNTKKILEALEMWGWRRMDRVDGGDREENKEVRWIVGKTRGQN